MEALWKFRSRHSDLVGTTINIHNGVWTRRGIPHLTFYFEDTFLYFIIIYLLISLIFLLLDSGVGAGIDSYYEYCLKAYILFGDETYRDKFNKVCF